MPDVEAEFSFLTTEQGGRSTPILSDYRPVHRLRADLLTSGKIEFFHRDVVLPGETASGTITFIQPEQHPRCLWPGREIAFLEGSRMIGVARITKVLNPLLETRPPSNPFLLSTEIIDWDHPTVMERARALAAGREDVAAIAKVCFEWVRDEVAHSRDFERNPVTWRASDVLLHRTGYCYAKSHLLAALLRANGIPAGFCYQRLSVGDSGPPYCLHGFNAIELPGVGWYRVDPRGNRAGIDAQFTPPVERLAFALQSAEEVEFANVLAEPLQCVVDSLRSCGTWEEALANLPDVGWDDVARLGLVVRGA